MVDLESQQVLESQGMLSGNSDGTMTDARFYSVVGETTESDEDDLGTIVTFIATLSPFYVEMENAPGVGKSVIITVRKNKIDTSVKVTIANPDTEGSDTSNSFDVIAGDKLTLQLTCIGGDTSEYTQWGLGYTI